MPRPISDYIKKSWKPNWCPGCGNYAILTALRQALCKKQFAPDSVVLVGGIGCGANLPYGLDTYGLISLHGRSIPAAMGIKLAKPGLQVIVIAGDGDTYGIGLGHFIQAIRNDVNITLLVCNNGVYGLTKGQASPTADKGLVSPSTPHGSNLPPLDPISLAIVAGGRFVARGYAGEVKHLTELVEQALSFQGFSYVDILQPCVTFNKTHSYEYYGSRVEKYAPASNDLFDKMSALKNLRQDPNRIPIGLLYLNQHPDPNPL